MWSMKYPERFDATTYSDWHGATFPADSPLKEKLDNLRDNLIDQCLEPLSALARILTYTANYCLFEYEQHAKTATDYNIHLLEALTPNPGSLANELLFKSTDSIINKLWRKNNKPVPDIHLGNLRHHIKDLVRTDISATTLDSAAFLATRMNALPGIIHDEKIRKSFDEWIESVDFGPEMKMESGYFAYHGSVVFKSGLVAEVQIYSDLMRQWRRLSHHLYERARTIGKLKHEFNSKESRLISLGHLLHLAECELRQLAQDFSE
jgi:ppGpp synthetase/RelA/SpoT-type nucleotidyltranferase